jgi:hypothetical protein
MWSAARVEFADPFCKEGFVERNDLRNVRHRILGQISRSCTEPYIARRVRPFQIARERHAYDGADLASVQSVSLNDDNRPAKTWP